MTETDYKNAMSAWWSTDFTFPIREDELPRVVTPAFLEVPRGDYGCPILAALARVERLAARLADACDTVSRVSYGPCDAFEFECAHRCRCALAESEREQCQTLLLRGHARSITAYLRGQKENSYLTRRQKSAAVRAASLIHQFADAIDTLRARSFAALESTRQRVCALPVHCQEPASVPMHGTTRTPEKHPA
ncbi:hypothetical protein [Geminisphaera colitermitum]|uniref:hypothetical protein n=1 Tax=Geminisphaera colitermitum TaxID=1148786 RepID=UPI000158C61B|nr:hypothetical protein [Geminisphaera colitermitum]